MAKKTYAGMTYDTKTGKFKYTPMSTAEMQRQVSAEVMPTYNAQKTVLVNQLQQGKLGLVNQQMDVNRQFDKGVTQLGEAYKNQVESANQNLIGNQMARSSYAGNVQDELGAKNQGAIADLTANRNQAVGDIQNQRNALQTEYNNAALSLDTDRMKTLAENLKKLKDDQLGRWISTTQWNQSVKR
jgi:hypothetical protein